MELKTNTINETSIWKELKETIDSLPSENSYFMPGLKWGCFSQMYTPAFWKLQYMAARPSDVHVSHKLAPTLVEETVMCILGGYGIPSEVGILAFNYLKQNNLLRRNVAFHKIYQVLASPMEIAPGKKIRYRFYNQKSNYIYRFLNRRDLDEIPEHNDIELRNWLLSIDGIGLKTASWITRNWTKSNKVAIIDVHLIRAGKLTGFFKEEFSNYLKLEQQYLAFCTALDVEPSDMDAIIWGYMKKNAKLASKIVNS